MNWEVELDDLRKIKYTYDTSKKFFNTFSKKINDCNDKIIIVIRFNLNTNALIVYL